MNQRLSISLLLGVILTVAVFVAFALAGGSNRVALAEDDVEIEAPDVGPITGATDPVPVATQISVSAAITDMSPPELVAEWNWGDGNTSPGDIVADPPGSPTYSVIGSHSYNEPGVFEVQVSVTNANGVSDVSVFQYAVAYDPTAGFVTGGGWINSPPGACSLDPCTNDTTGKATFGFVSKYKKGATTPTGNTEFQFKAGDLDFHSSSYQWLVVTGPKAQFKGDGTINGEGEYKFKIWAGDDDPDTFRIKIWWEDTDGIENPVYDNGVDQSIGGGSIVIHKGK